MSVQAWRPLKGLLFGVALGAALGGIGFTDYDEVQKMFLLEDWRLFLVFGGGVVLTALGFFLVPRARTLPRRVFHPGVIIGSLIFGVGWALCGACPGVVFAQVGEGRWPALVTLAGVLGGVQIAGWARARFLHWDTGSC